MKNHIWHIVATLIVGVWGLTFISTKVLIESGMSPQEIFLARFLIAYVSIWFISPRKLFAYNWKDELLMLASGITGGSFFPCTKHSDKDNFSQQCVVYCLYGSVAYHDSCLAH